MWPPEQGKSRLAADVKAEIGSQAKHKKWAGNQASKANSVLDRLNSFPFQLRGVNGEGAALVWDEVSDGIS